MRNKSLWKDSIRTIKNTFTRFLSLVAIIALGAGFFVGIRATEPNMIDTQAEYYQETNFQDIHIQSTYGLRDEDVSLISAVDGISYFPYKTVDRQDIEHALLYRIYPNFNEASEMNHFAVQSGRLPENPNEIALDTQLIENGITGYEIGSTISFNELGVSDVEEAPNLNRKEFEVVGFVRSPMYIDLASRGNTNIGKGTIDAFAVVDPSVFTGDFYTSIGVKVNDANTFKAHSSEYIALVSAKQEEIEAAFADRPEDMYAEIISDAESEIADGEQELADARLEIADAEAEIADGRKQIEDAKIELAEAEQELLDGEAELAEQRANIEDALPAGMTLADVEAELNAAEAELADAREKLESGWASFEKEKATVEAELAQAEADLEIGRQELADGEAELAQAKQDLADAEAELEAGWLALEEGQTELDAGKAELENTISTALGGKTIAEVEAELAEASELIATREAELETGRAQLAEAEASLAGAQVEIEAEEASLEAWIQEIEADLPEGTTIDDIDDPSITEPLELARTELNKAKDLLAERQAIYTDMLAELTQGEAELEAAKIEVNTNSAQIEVLKRQVALAEAEIEAGQTEINNNRALLAQAQAEFDAAKPIADAEIASGEAELEQGRTEIAEAEAQIAEARTAFQEAEDVLIESEQQLIDAETEFNSEKNKLLNSLPEGYTLASIQTELNDAEEQLADGRTELEEARVTLAEEEAQANKDIAIAEVEIADAKIEIEDGEADLREARRELADLIEPNYIIEDRSFFMGYQEYKDNANRIGAVGQVFPVIFFLIAALVSYTVMKRMVEEERTRMGTYKALGYNPAQISLKFVLYAVSTAVLGIIVGVLVGNRVIPMIIIGAYGMMYELSEPQVRYYATDIILTIVITTLVTLGPALLTSRKSLQEAPSQLMRPKPPKSGKNISLEKLTWFWEKLSYNYKVTLRNLSRFMGRNSMVVIGVAGCIMLLVVGFGLSDSIGGLANRQFEEIQLLDVQMQYHDNVTDEEVEAFRDKFLGENGAEYILNVHTETLDTTNGAINKQSATLNVFDKNDDYASFYRFYDLESGERLETLPEDGYVYLTEKLAKLHDIGKGDTLTLQDEHAQTYEFIVGAVVENYLGHNLFMDKETYRQIVGGAENIPINSAFIQFENGDRAQQNEVVSQMLEEEIVLGSFFIEDARTTFNDTLETLNLVNIILILAAGILNFIVLYSLININVTERSRELSTLKVLGASTMQVTNYIYREVAILVLLGIMLGLILGPPLLGFILQLVEIDIMIFPVNIDITSYLYSIGLALVFSVVVMFFMYYKLKRIDMVEAMKGVE